MTEALTEHGLSSYAMALGDDALVLSHRFGEWVTRAPQLEEDVALANIGLDLLGQARTLLSYAGSVEGRGRDEDALAYLRGPAELRNVRLVELDNGDFAVSMARLLVFSTYQLELYRRLLASRDPVLSAVAGKAVKEVAYHRDHATEWVLRLGDGTAQSAQRMQAGLEQIWPYVDELFDGGWIASELIERGVAVDPGELRTGCDAYVRDVLARARLEVPQQRSDVSGRGRSGDHTPALTGLLDEMQELHRAHPGATW